MPDANGAAQPVYLQNRVRSEAVILLERGNAAGEIVAAELRRYVELEQMARCAPMETWRLTTDLRIAVRRRRVRIFAGRFRASAFWVTGWFAAGRDGRPRHSGRRQPNWSRGGICVPIMTR